MVWRPYLLLSLFATVAVLCIATRADAASFTTSCPDPTLYTSAPEISTAVSCAAITERQEATVAQLEANATKLDAIQAATEATASAPAATSLSLDALDSQKLDLIWSGVWFTGGVAFGVWAFRRLGREASRWGYGT
jgi:hypothetical protein